MSEKEQSLGSPRNSESKGQQRPVPALHGSHLPHPRGKAPTSQPAPTGTPPELPSAEIRHSPSRRGNSGLPEKNKHKNFSPQG